jgi:hypothetical protein
MKIYYIKAIAVLALSLAFTACSKDEETVLGTGTVALEFDNSFKGDDLILDTNKHTNNEVLKVTIKYIISNVVLKEAELFCIKRKLFYCG